MKEWFCGMTAFDVKFNKNLQFCWLFLAKIINFGLEPHISDAKTAPFIPFGADLFVYLNHIGIQITQKITGEKISCV